jgi:hypothetical protein
MGEAIKYMDLGEFVGEGFLQEANRQFFHPLGLALAVQIGADPASDPEGRNPSCIVGVWDYRDDPEGVVFAGEPPLDAEKTRRVAEERSRHVVPREALGFPGGVQHGSYDQDRHLGGWHRVTKIEESAR